MNEGHRVILRETDQSHSSKGIDAMTAAHDIDWPAVLAERLTTTHPDVLRELLATFAHTLMGAEADAVCGAGYGERSSGRTNQRNGYRHRQFDTRAGTLDRQSLSCGMVRTSRTGCWNAASAPSER
jgi:putative transposase